ncbi:cilia- and flagella-associated protein 36 [Rhagoletis pomonella]|uniref:cilia- and flagella-associated protein 36 n=1 Tax=Rhagoletis pomonella TaxID=28610 RepID=UPI001786CB61|nr:cilia- and flagella-associated protein 36 [Rhagoletis pomonella]
MTEDSWVLDSLVCFLHGPVWNAPLQTFIEEKSLVFDPNMQIDENNSDIVAIHNEYKNLVDYMLGSFMEEMQITPEQFETACMEGRNPDNHLHFHQGLFQQIWAANDIKMFIRMMTQRNVELQLQALDLIEKNQLALLQESEPADNASSTETSSSHCEKYDEVENFIAKSLEKELESPEAAVTPEPESVDSSVNEKFARLNLFFDNQRIDPDDVVSRQEYLRQQRDKIVEIKKKTRAKQLLETVARKSATSQASTGRPSSAQVAQKLLENGGKATELLEKENVGEGAGEGEPQSSALQLRKTLAKRLRAEVVEHE